MNTKLKSIGIIPARYGSTRFPGKSLASILGKPMIQWVYERAMQAAQLDRVIVATDDQRIFDVVVQFHGEVMMTRSDHHSGTDRIAELAEQLEADVIVNIQGDEPLIDPVAIDAAIQPLAHFPQLQMTTLVTHFADEAEWQNPNVVKAVCDNDGAVLYFSRSPIPYPRCQSGVKLARKHIGLYAYRRDFLLMITQFPPHPLEIAEGLEQLRVLTLGEKIVAVETDYQSIGVDTPDDIEQAEAKMRKEGLA